MACLETRIGNLCLKNPVMTASGTFGYGIEYQDFIRLEDLGGIIVKGTTLQTRVWTISAPRSIPRYATSAPT